MGPKGPGQPEKAVSSAVPQGNPAALAGVGTGWDQRGFTQSCPHDPSREVGSGPSTGSSPCTTFGKEGTGGVSSKQNSLGKPQKCSWRRIMNKQTNK